MHDDICQKLAAVGLAVSSVKRQLEIHSPAAERIDKVLSSINTLARSIRAVSHQLHPVMLEKCGLEEAIRSLGAETSELTGIQVSVVRTGDLILPPGVALCVFRICQEALQNVSKHSGATRVNIVLRSAPRSVHLMVLDNGNGFDSEIVRSSNGIGLASLDERARLFGGIVRLERGHPCGSVLRARIPLAPSAVPLPKGGRRARPA